MFVEIEHEIVPDDGMMRHGAARQNCPPSTFGPVDVGAMRASPGILIVDPSFPNAASYQP